MAAYLLGSRGTTSRLDPAHEDIYIGTILAVLHDIVAHSFPPHPLPECTPHINRYAGHRPLYGPDAGRQELTKPIGIFAATEQAAADALIADYWAQRKAAGGGGKR